MDFDYYQIKGKWNAATLNRRAEKLEEAQAAADELEEAGAKGVEIIGVKAGKRETIRGKKKAPKAAKTPKAKKATAKKKKAAQAAKKQKDKISEMSADDLRAIDSIFSHDGKIKILKTNTPKREPAGQLDLFTGDESKTVILKFSESELKTLINDYYDLISSGERLTNYKSLLTTFEKANAREKIELTKKEIKSIIGVLQKYMKKNISNKGVSSIYGQTKELKDSFVKAYYNV